MMNRDMISKQSVEYAPVIIPTLSRYEHLENCIRSLSSCTGADKTDIYISVDHPPNPGYKEGYQKVVEYLKNGINGFSNVYIFYQENNLGMMGNLSFLVDSVREKHSCFIYTEDDNEFSPNFLEFINTALVYYKDREDVIAVSGYSYPIEHESKGNTYVNPLYFSYHGCGMYLKDYDRMTGEIDLKWLMGLYRDKHKMDQLRRVSPNQYCNLVKSVLGYIFPIIDGDNVRPIDLACGIYLFDKGLKMAFPAVSKVINRGYDGSGADCEELIFDETKSQDHRNYPYDKQPMDPGTEFGQIIEENINENDLFRMLDKFFAIGDNEIHRTKSAYVISRILGIKLTGRILNGVKN